MTKDPSAATPSTATPLTVSPSTAAEPLDPPLERSGADAGDVDSVVAALHLEWTFGWEQEPDSPQFDFHQRFAHLYDTGSHALYYDDFDPQHRVFTDAATYGSTWQSSFRGLRSARHGIALAPQVLASGDIASSWGVLVARIEPRGGEPVYLRTTSHLLWRRTDTWRLVRDLTSSQVLTREEFTPMWRAASHIRTADLDA